MSEYGGIRVSEERKLLSACEEVTLWGRKRFILSQHLRRGQLLH